MLLHCRVSLARAVWFPNWPQNRLTNRTVMVLWFAVMLKASVLKGEVRCNFFLENKVNNQWPFWREGKNRVDWWVNYLLRYIYKKWYISRRFAGTEGDADGIQNTRICTGAKLLKNQRPYDLKPDIFKCLIRSSLNALVQIVVSSNHR